MSPKIIEISKSDGRLKRIEYRGKYLRASRTGGVALRAQGKAAGVNFTVNSSHGTRVSTRIAKGTNVGFQNGRFVLRGRYGKGPTKLNLSKSGVSVSTKTSFGTINWLKPKYSSVKVGGFQFRGKNAIIFQISYLLVEIFYFIAKLIFEVFIWLLKTLYDIIISIVEYLKKRKLEKQRQSIEVLEINWREKFKNQSNEDLICVLFYTLIVIGRGKSEVSSGFIDHLLSDYDDKEILRPIIGKIDDENIESAVELTISSLYGHSTNQILLIEAFFCSIAEIIKQRLKPNIIIPLFWALDYCVIKNGKRNHLQEKLLAGYADTCGIESN